MVLPVNSGCYPGYSRRFYILGVSSSLVTLHVFVLYKTWIFTQYICGLTYKQWMLIRIQQEILFPWSFFVPWYISCLCLVQDLDLYSVYQWSYLSIVDVTLDTVRDSISLECLLALLTFKSLFGTRLGSLLSISVVLPVNSGCYPGYSRRFYIHGVSSSLATLHVFVWYKTWIFTQYISGLTCQQWMLPWMQ